MSSDTEISNMALSHLGVGYEIQNLETEQSQEAAACRRYFEIALKTTLTDSTWPFANATASLALVEEEPNTEWGYSYRYPVDCLHATRILSGYRNDTHDSKIPYKISKDSAGKLIFSDIENAVLEYVSYVEDPQFYPADFTLALSYKLAFLIAPRVTAGDPFGVREQIARLYEAAISNAKRNAANEERPDLLPDSSLIKGRE